jgi:hypothetical protein
MRYEYLTYRETDEIGRLCFYILQKAYPHYSGLIVTNPVEGAIINSPISGYRLWVTWNGTLRGNILPATKDALKEIESVYFDMAKFFYEQRILKDLKKYKHFKLSNDKVGT